MMRQTKDRRNVEKRLEKLWKAKVLAKWGNECQWGKEKHCDCKSGLVAHHIFSRQFKGLKFNTDNGICLCSGHHRFIAHDDRHKEEFRDFLISKIGQDLFDRLKMQTREATKFSVNELEMLYRSEKDGAQ